MSVKMYSTKMLATKKNDIQYQKLSFGHTCIAYTHIYEPLRMNRRIPTVRTEEQFREYFLRERISNKKLAKTEHRNRFQRTNYAKKKLGRLERVENLYCISANFYFNVCSSVCA